MAHTVDEYNGQIKIEVTDNEGNIVDEILVNPCYWDEETNEKD